MRLGDAVRYLAGDRGAILRIARTRGALCVGAILVLTGSVARNYDGADLVGEWKVLTHGIGASIVNALLLYTLAYAAARAHRQERPRFFSGFLSFLGLFWMTAPTAWLYAVPYERFLTPVEAVNANTWTLALVAVWRVALITRVLAVIWGARYMTVLFIVLFFADAALVAGTLLAPMPVVDFMGGMEQSPADTALVVAANRLMRAP